MLQVTVKTLDSQNHSFSVPDESTVKEFKEQIAPVLNISVEKQRLIFCGKVLKDEKKLSEYDVDGKVIHVVQSLPPQGNSSSSSSSSSTTTTSNSRPRGGQDGAGFLLGAFSIPQELVDPNQVQNIVHDVVQGMGEIGRNATVMSRASDDGTVDVHINLGRVPVNGPQTSEAQSRMNRVQTMLLRASHLLDTLEDGSNSSNGTVADSSSQTENGSTNSESENAVPESTNPSSNPEHPLNNPIFDTNISNAEITSEINLDVPNGIALNPEGLAHAAQAAISAGFATAAAVARAAASSEEPNSTFTQGAQAAIRAVIAATEEAGLSDYSFDSVPLDLRTGSSEPMEESSAEPDLLDSNLGAEETIVVDTPPDSETSSTPSEAKSQTPSEPVTSTQGPSSTNATAGLPTANSSMPTSEASQTPQRGRPNRQVQPSVQTLANLLDEVIRFNNRLTPHLEKVRDLIRNDAPLAGRPCADAQRLFSRISQMVHFLSHAYHSLSDLHVNFTHAPPRSPRVRIISSTSTTLLQGVPMQAQISISTSSGPSPISVSNTTTTANNPPRSESTPSTNSESRPSAQPTTPTPTTPAPSADPQAGTNPLVFMEVSPTVTFDGIASMLSQSLGSVVQMSNGTNTFPSSGTSTTNTPTANVSTNAPSSQGETTPQAPRNIRPYIPAVNPGTLSMPALRSLIPMPLSSVGLNAFDPGLPCNSVWALEPSRRRHNAGGSRNSNQMSNLTPNIPGRQEDQLQQVISGIVMSLLNHSQGQLVPGTINVGTTHATPFASYAGQTNRDRVSRPERNTASPSRVHFRSSSVGASPDMRSTVQMLTNVGLINKTIAEVFPSEMRNAEFDLLGNFFWFLANNLTFQDLTNIVSRNFESLERIKAPLQKYLKEKVFQSDNPQLPEYNRVSAQIMSDIKDELLKFSTSIGVPPSRTRAYTSDFERLLGYHLHRVFDAMLDRSTCRSFISYSQHICMTSRALFDEFLRLHAKYSTMDTIGLETVFRRQLEPLTDIIDPLYQHPVRVFVLTSLFKLMFGVRNFASSSRDNSQPSTASGSTGADKPKEEKKPTPSQAPPTGDVLFGNLLRSGLRQYMSNGNGDQTDNSNAPARSAFARIAERTNVLLRGSSRPNDNSTPGVNVTEVVIRPESWHSSIPQDWVPIITRDVQRQRRQAPQPPYSNAYLSGMPSKRRKIMTNDTPALLEQSQNTLSDMLLQAISSAGVQPRTSIEEIKEDVSQDTDLQSSFTEHMKQAIQERLQRDLDYCSEKFPNSEKYYNI